MKKVGKRWSALEAKYLAMINEEISMLECEPVFKDVTRLVEKNPALTLEELISELLSDRDLEKDEKHLRDSISSYLSSDRAYSSSLLYFLDLSQIDIGRGAKGSYNYREIIIDGRRLTSLRFGEHRSVRAVPLFQDAVATLRNSQLSEKTVRYKGLYIVVSRAQQGGMPYEVMRFE
ncbi:MAG: hypothetical protein QW471_00510 [Candidatus Woesearchaeota archaeon]